MGRRRGKRIILAAGALSLAVIAMALWHSRGILIEGFQVWRLRSSDPARSRAAVEVLGERGSALAVPYLIMVVSLRTKGVVA